MKRILSMMLAVLMLLTFIPVSISAADTLTISSPDVSAAPGETVDVVISIENNPGVTIIGFKLDYDSSVMKPTAVVAGTAFPTTTGNTAKDPLTLSFYNATNVTANGIYATVTFKIDDNAAAGTYDFAIVSNGTEIYNQDYDDIAHTFDIGSVTVKAADVPVTGVTLNKTATTLKVGDTETLTATVTPDNATDKTVTWSSNNSSVAGVDGGVITALSAGTAKITAKAGSITATCDVTVEAAPAGDMIISSPAISTAPGEIVDVVISIENNPGVTIIGFKLDYDASVMKPTAVVAGTAFPTTSGNTAKAPLTLSFYNATNVTANGIYATVSFKIDENAPAGTYDLAIVPNGTEIYNQNYDDITPIFNIGAITVVRTEVPKVDFPAGLALSQKEVTYDGTPKSFTKDDITGGTLPEGTTVTFEGNGVTNVGTHTVKATLTAEGYNDKTIEGTIKINPKNLTVTGFDAVDRDYDGTTVVTLKPGTLTGVVAGDDVTHNVPATGTIASKNVGIPSVIFDSITLTGADAGNYTLTQPAAAVLISPKNITVVHPSYDATDRDYNGSYEFEMKAGTLDGVLTGDDVSANWPKTGISVDSKGDPTANVGTWSVKFDEVTLTGADAANYELSEQPKSYVAITPKPITVTADSVSKYVGEAKAKLTYVVDTAAIVGSDSVNVTGDLACAVDINTVGTYPITVGTLAIDNANYKLNFVGANYTVMKKSEQNPGVTGYADKTYGDASFKLTANPYFQGGAYTFESKTPAVVSVDNNGNVTVLGAGSAHIAVKFAGNNQYEEKTIDVKFNVAKRDITVAADNAEKTVNTTDPALTWKITAGSLATGDEITGNLVRKPGEGVGTFAIEQGTLTVTAGGASKIANYNFTFVPGTFTINEKKTQNVTVDSIASFKYDGTKTVDIKVNYDTASGCTETAYSAVNVTPAGCMTVNANGVITVNGAGTATFVVTVKGNEEYADITKNVTLTVNKREIKVIPTAGQFKYVGKADPAKFDYTTTGDELLPGDTIFGKLARTAGETAGQYAYNLGTLIAGANYNLTLDTANKFEIKAAQDQDVNFNAIPAKTYGDAAFNLGVSVNSYSGAKASYDSSDKSVATVDANGKVTIIGAGETNITVTVPASENGQYSAYTKTQKLTVNKKTLTVTPVADQWKYEEQIDPVLDYSVTGFVGNDTEASVISGKLSRAAGESVGKYDYKLDGLTANANYKLTLAGNAQFEVRAKLTTNVKLESTVVKTYGDSAFSVGAQITASALSAKLEYKSDNTSVATVDANGNVTIIGAGTAKITVTIKGNYEYKDYTGVQTVTVNKKAVTVTADNTGKRIGTADPELTYTATALAYNDKFEGKLTRDPGEDAKDYAIKQGTLTIVDANGASKIANYNLTFNGAKFTISDKLTQKVTVPTVSAKTYGDAGFSVKATVIESYNGAAPKYASSNTNVATVDNDGNVVIKGAGETTITVTVDGNVDYNAFKSEQKLTVAKKQIIVTPAEGQWKRISKADPELAYTYDEALLVGNDAITGKLGRAAGEQPGEYAFTLGTLTAGVNYELILADGVKFEIKAKEDQDVSMPELPSKITYGDEKILFVPVNNSIDDPTVTYTTTDDEVAYVDENGDLIIAGKGKTEITITVEGNDDYNAVSKTYSVKVNKKQIKIKDFDPVNKTVTFEEGSVVDGDEVSLDIAALDVKIETVIGEDGESRTVVTFSGLSSDNDDYIFVSEIDDNYEDPDDSEETPAVTVPSVEVDLGDEDNADIAEELTEQIVTVKIDAPFGSVQRHGVKVEESFDTIIGITETLVAVPQANYKFDTWTVGGKTTDKATVTFTVTDELIKNGEIEARAAFSVIYEAPIVIPEYRVIFESNGGSEVPSVLVYEGERVERPDDPVRKGYIFDGWYDSIYLDEKFNFKTEIYEFTVIFAKWVKDEAPETEVPEIPETPDEPVVTPDPVWQNPFTDVNPADWFYSVVEYVNSKGIMNGVDAALFAPNGQVTRAMFVTMLHRLEGEPEAAEAAFADVTAGAWYAAAINWASANGIVNGVSETEFAPNTAITREQMATILYRYAGYKKYDVAVKDSTLSFNDTDAISDYALTAIVWAVENGLMQGNGDNTVAPKNAATRAEAAAVLMRAIENLK